VHNAFLVGKEGTKISKSAGKFPLLSDLVASGIDPLAFRIFCFGAKYRSEIAFNDEAIRAAQSNLDYFREFARSVPDDATAEGVEAAGWAAEYYERFHDAINNDLNTPQAIAAALDLIAEAYRRKDFRAWPTLLALDVVLGLDLAKHRVAAQSVAIEPDVQRLIDNRAAARKAKDFITADDLRAEIERRGYEVKDNRDGTATYRKRGAGEIV
jgi:cysteinyl-tRNA synthetase